MDKGFDSAANAAPPPWNKTIVTIEVEAWN